MLHWTLLGEFYALLILGVLFIRYYIYEKETAYTARRKNFVYCLTMSMLLICLNILCVYTLDNPDRVPRRVNILLNTAYFLWAICVSSQFAYMFFDTMLEHVYDKHCLRRATIVLISILVLAVGLLVWNLFSGILFRIDEIGIYHRGPLNRAYYGLLLLQMVFLCICYVRNRSCINDRMVYVMRSAPPLVIILCILQFAFPDVLLNGTICALVSLVAFIAFRSHTEDHDSLTNARSRKSLMDELALRSGSGQAVQLIQISLTDIAEVNLLYSHSVGDALIYELAHYLRSSFRHSKVFRSGGTTFTMMLPLTSHEVAEAQLQSILHRMGQGWDLGDTHYKTTYAIADFRSWALSGTPSEIIERIEYTLEQAKKDPPLARYDNDLSQQIDYRLHLISQIRRGIDQKHFQVVYQPIYCCRRNLFCSAEALLRLSDEDGTPIPPDVFIPIAENNGMILELTWVVLEAICEMLSSSKLPGLESVSMNLTTRQLMDPDLYKKIQLYLQRYQINPSRLRIEVTEQFIFKNPQFALEQMQALERLGLQIYMDDFGTGYSNLSSVLRFPFSVVKLDRSLITPAADSKQAAIMVSALMELFRKLDKRVIMEGVETAEQVAFLQSIGTDMIQGYYFAKPVPGEKLIEYFGQM